VGGGAEGKYYEKNPDTNKRRLSRSGTVMRTGGKEGREKGLRVREGITRIEGTKVARGTRERRIKCAVGAAKSTKAEGGVSRNGLE